MASSNEEKAAAVPTESAPNDGAVAVKNAAVKEAVEVAADGTEAGNGAVQKAADGTEAGNGAVEKAADGEAKSSGKKSGGEVAEGEESEESEGKSDTANSQKKLVDKETAQVAVKLLMSNSAVGAIIGKGGANVAEIKKDTKAGVKISQARQHFPGSSDRMVLITGGIPAVLAAVHLVFSKLRKELAPPEPQEDAEDGDSDEQTHEIKMAVLALCCGAIIGKKGGRMRKFKRDSEAKITISPQDPTGTVVEERVITISGTLEQQLRAVALIVTQMVEDPNYNVDATPMSYNIPRPNVESAGGGRRGSRGGRDRKRGTGPPAVPAGSEGEVVEKTIDILDSQAGIIIGSGGTGLARLHRATGVRLHVSKREDLVPESEGKRQVTLSGHPQRIAKAEAMITKRLHAAVSSEEKEA